MLIRAIDNCDAGLGPRKQALFRGQVYDLPPEMALPLVAKGLAEDIETKMVPGPPANKAVAPAQNKRKGGRKR